MIPAYHLWIQAFFFFTGWGLLLLIRRMPMLATPIRPWYRRLRAGVGWLAGRPLWAMLSLAGVTFGWLIVLMLIARPHPVAHDEYAYRLAADTFVRGRLTNPAHPLWPFFESFHTIQLPFYAAKYPPGQGLVMAAGQWLAGDPIAGICGSYVLMVLAIYRLLRMYVPPVPAYVGALLTATHALFLLNWGVGYWGGALLGLGGALVWHATLQLERASPRREPPFPAGTYRFRGPALADVLGLTIGAALLLLTRPFEGVVFLALPGLLWLERGWRAVRDRRGPVLLRTGLGLAGLVLALLLLLGYNYRVTGDALKMPYTYYYEQYEQARPLLFQEPGGPKTYRRAAMQHFHQVETELFAERRTGPGFLRGIWQKISLFGTYYWGILFIGPFLYGLMRRRLKPRSERLALLSLGSLLLANALCTYEMPAYIAAGTGSIVALTTVGGYQLWRRPAWRRPAIRRLLLAAMLATVPVLLVEAVMLTRRTVWKQVEFRRASEQKLAATGQPHLILVRYGPAHNPYHEWVFNLAVPDAQPVVWAADKGPLANRQLLTYYANRRVWRLDADEQPLRLKPVRSPLNR